MKVLINWGTGSSVVEMPTSTKLALHFTLKEMANNEGDPTEPQFEITKESAEFLKMLEEFRRWYNHPMHIGSCFRQANFNAKLAYADKRSAHIHACAVDWHISGHNEQQRANVYNQWKRICQVHRVIGSCNLYTNGYHLEAFSDKWYGQGGYLIRDYRGKPADW